MPFGPRSSEFTPQNVSENIDEDERDDEGERDGRFIGREAPELIADQNQNRCASFRYREDFSR